MNRKGFTLIELMIVIAIIAIIAAIAIPGILSATRAANERNASGSMKQLTSIQVTFKTTDSDANGLADYWVGDVSGLYWIGSGNTPVNEGIKLIEPSMASADSSSKRKAGNTYSSTNFSTITTLANMGPKAGYWFQVLLSWQGIAVNTAYDPGSGKNPDKFGVLALPHSYGGSGKMLFILCEEGTQFKKDAGQQTGTAGSTGVSASNVGVWSSAATTPVAGTLAGYTLGVTAVNTYPLDALATSGWSKMD